MTKAEEILRKEITMFDWSNCGRKTQMIPYEDALKAMNKAINYTDSCAELCDNKVEVLTVKPNGVWYDGCKQEENA